MSESKLFTPLKVGAVTVPNRVFMAPLTRLRSIEPGDTAQPGKALLTLAPNGDTELTAQIDEKNFGLLALGQNAHVSADAYPGEQFPATLSYIAPSIDALRGSVEIRLAVPQPPATLRHEMTVSIDIEAARRPDALSLPCDSLHEAAGHSLYGPDGRSRRGSLSGLTG